MLLALQHKAQLAGSKQETLSAKAEAEIQIQEAKCLTEKTAKGSVAV